MQRLLVVVMAFGVIACSGLMADEMLIKVEPVTPAHRTSLFNGVDFNGWTKVINAEKGADPDTTFTVRDGVIRCTGKPFGYLATQQSYADFKLRLEYRWYGESEQVNSGIFCFKTGPDNFFLPKCIETQLKKGSAGDLLMLSKATMNGLENERNRVVEKLAASSEKPDGEWNEVEIVARGNTITATVNGVLQNMGRDIYTSSGQICLQSEGGLIEFRYITIEPLR